MSEQVEEVRFTKWFLEQSVGDIRFIDISGGNYLCGLVLSTLWYCSGEKYDVVPIDKYFYEQCVLPNKHQMKLVLQRLEKFDYITSAKNKKTKLLECKINAPLILEKINELPGCQYVI